MAATLSIEFISDIACPWCLVGLRNLETALAETAGEIETDLHFSPFELNPDMPVEGMERARYFAEK